MSIYLLVEIAFTIFKLCRYRSGVSYKKQWRFRAIFSKNSNWGTWLICNLSQAKGYTFSYVKVRCPSKSVRYLDPPFLFRRKFPHLRTHELSNNVSQGSSFTSIYTAFKTKKYFPKQIFHIIWPTNFRKNSCENYDGTMSSIFTKIFFWKSSREHSNNKEILLNFKDLAWFQRNVYTNRSKKWNMKC